MVHVAYLSFAHFSSLSRVKYSFIIVLSPPHFQCILPLQIFGITYHVSHSHYRLAVWASGNVCLAQTVAPWHLNVKGRLVSCTLWPLTAHLWTWGPWPRSLPWYASPSIPSCPPVSLCFIYWRLPKPIYTIMRINHCDAFNTKTIPAWFPDRTIKIKFQVMFEPALPIMNT